MEIDNDKNLKPLSVRERLTIKILLLVAQMIYPSRWNNDLEKALTEIRNELNK